uniref:Uncharacterized protein n=1 Tax=Candidatus Kentrum sp. TC TaxID=2126339 RepID=A0A450YAY2_9GAMM|nr:MAG: hypothetical protein BECKTC1821D_GA0114238_100540 [Candidatus Kentron sp. TC]
MDNCLERLRAFAESNPAYEHAIRNIRRDLRSKDNPHGNIGPERAKALASACADEPLPSLPNAIAKCRTMKRPDLAVEQIQKPPHAPLRRVMSLTCFVTYHMVSGADSHLSAERAKREFRNTEEYRITRFRGATGHPEKPTWWTFREGDAPPTTGDGEHYLRELALSEATIKEAMENGMAVEVIVPEQIIPNPLYKPCALDGFDEGTQFQPDLTDAPFGRTVPLDPGLSGHPELISESLPYEKMDADGIRHKDIRLTVRPIPIANPPNIDHTGDSP